MASLILHGDINPSEPELTRLLHVRPVMHGDGIGRREVFPPDELPVDLVYRAVRRIFESEGNAEPTAPSVRLINLSLGDEFRPFSGMMSPWARLIDYLSWRYGVLFLISAGNVKDQLAIENVSKWTDFESATPERRRDDVLRAIIAKTSQRSIIAPAESVNSLTVGALHDDSRSSMPSPTF